MAGELPIFRLAGKLTARPSSLARAITERERASMAAQHAEKAA
jgi:hypothetical protein